MQPTHTDTIAAAAESRLRNLVQRYGMTYHVMPDWGPDAKWNQQKTGFAIELYAVPNPERPFDQQSPTDRIGLVASYGALREVLGWALGAGAEDVCITTDDYENRVVQQIRTNAWRAELVAHVTHCNDVRRPIDEREQRYLGDVRQRLASLGVHEI